MWADEFQGLMPFRIQEILLVSSAYDAFILEEDGALTDRLFSQYSELQLTGVPRVTHATSAAHAMEELARRRFELVVTVVRVQDTAIGEFSRRIKADHPDLPIVLLLFDETDLDHFADGTAPDSIDLVFLWTGDARGLLAAIKLSEDRLNVAHDTATAGVRVILVVEDRMRVYSTFLSMLYPALLSQAQSMIGDGLNDMQRVLRMRSRPRILLSTTYDEGLALYQRYRDNMMALISDVRFPQGGVLAPNAGLDLARMVRAEHPRLPILLQSAEPNDEEAAALGAWFLDKRSPGFRDGLRLFLEVGLGFGDFVFRLPEGTEVGRAGNIFEMHQVLREVPGGSLAMHAVRNDFSTWLDARGMFDLSATIRDKTPEDFADEEAIRRYLLDTIDRARLAEQEGVVVDFAGRHTGPQNRFVRLGRGSLGGKGRSIAFVASLIVRHGLLDRFEGLEVRIPKTVVIGTDVFDTFMSQYDLRALDRLEENSDVLETFLAGALPDAIRADLRAAFDPLRGPLAVRSSSVVEDSRFQPFAGVYATYMLPNNHPDPNVRFEELCRAIKAVYASAFSREARNYAAGTPQVIQGQKMAVVIQQVVGQRHGDRHYPHVSGVAESYNYYPIGAQRASDGVAVVALGMGETVVSGRHALRFSPGAPEVLPQFPTPRSMLEWTQTEFYAVDMARSQLDLHEGPQASLSLCNLQQAEEDGTLRAVGSVYCPDDDVIRDNLALAGPRVVSFRNILKWGSIPLAPALVEILGLLREAMGGEVELEFAVDMERSGSGVGGPRHPRLYLLQVRPLASIEMYSVELDFDALEPDSVLVRTRRSLGHGMVDSVCDVVYVRPEDPSPTVTEAIARQVASIDRALVRAKRPYLLAGPGRWGTSDRSLGIPVDYTDISGARVIVETPLGHRGVEYSQGTHFFQNITSRGIGYLTLGPRFDSHFDRAWLDAQPAVHETDEVRHVRLSAPLHIQLDGRHGHAAIIKPS